MFVIVLEVGKNTVKNQTRGSANVIYTPAIMLTSKISQIPTMLVS